MSVVSKKSPPMRRAELIPAILARDEADFRSKAARVADHAQTVQIDVMDGIFVANSAWADPQVIRDMHLPFVIEVHLMVTHPERVVDDWIMAGARRVFVHAEAPGNPLAAVEAMRAVGREGGIALNPDTPVATIADILPELDAVLVMGVTPGWSGQQFQSQVLGKVAELKRLRPELRVEVDGGVTPQIAADLAVLGCDGVVVASALFNTPDMKEAVASFHTAL